MDSVPALPLPADELPEGIRKFGDPSGPAPPRAMAAKGLVPVKGNELVTLLVQLTADSDTNVAQTAGRSLDGVPEGVLCAACEAPLHVSILDALARRFSARPDVIERIVRNQATSNATVAYIAARCDESTSELIATNQRRVLNAPAIIEALYRNPNTRMSTADRLIELAARNGVELDLPCFKEHVKAIQGQLIPEPTDEPLPSDEAFQQALAEDDDDPDAVERDVAEGTESVKEDFKPLHQRIREMNVAEKIRMALVGNSAARALLVRDPNKIVSHAAISSPKMTESEAISVAHSKEVSEEVLRYIGNRKEWVRSYEIKRALIYNPKTPIGISTRFIAHLRHHDLKALSRSRNVAAPIRVAANQRIQMKQRRK